MSVPVDSVPLVADADSPESWVDAHGSALYRYALVQLRDEHKAEESVQETFLAALQARQRFTGSASIRTWLIGILKHKILDQFRRGAQGTGSGLRVVADKPIGAIQSGDCDGADQTAFLPTAQLGVRFGVPVDAQYVAVVCPSPNTAVVLNDGANPPVTRTCSSSGDHPGKAHFGTTVNGETGIAAGAYIESDEPVYLNL